MPTPLLPSRSLAPTTRAALWLALAGLFAVSMNVVIRQAAAELHPFEVAFFRCLFGLAVMIPWIARRGLSVLRTGKIGFYTLRGAVSLVSMLTWFYGITLVPLGTATALNFTGPFFSTMGAWLVLREVVRPGRWAAIAMGFVGVLVILRPGSEALDPNLLIILFSAAMNGMSVVTMKFLARTEPPNAIVTMLVLYVTPLSLVPALFVWQWPSAATLLWLALLGALGTLAHLTTVRAYAAADASACAPFEYLRLPFAALLGWVAFGEVTDVWTWVGAAAIAASSLLVAHREARLARRAMEAAPTYAPGEVSRSSPAGGE
jgi:S-adenosylmethionine uptake transporter